MKYQKFLKMKNLLESSNQQAQEILSIQESLSARMDDDLKGLGETSRQCTETLRRLEEQTTEIQGIRSTILSARQMKPKDLDKILQSAYKTILKVYSQGKDRARIHRQILLQLQRVNFHQFQVRDSEHLAVDQLELIGSTLERVEEETLNFSIQPPQPYTNSVLQQQVTLINQKSVAVWNGIEKRKRLRSCLQALYTVVENKASQVEEKNKQLEEIVAECYLIVTGNSSHQTSRPPSPPPSSPGGGGVAHLKGLL